MRYLVFFIAFTILVSASAQEDRIQRALAILAEDGGSRGYDMNQAIRNQIASGKLVVKSESLRTEKRNVIGTARSKNGKLEIVVDTNRPAEEVAITIAHEYMHLSTATYLDRMETSPPNLFKSIERGYSLVNEISEEQKKLSR